MNKPRVIVTHEIQNADFRAAEKYGNVEFVTNMDVNGMANSLRDADIAADIKDAFQSFNPLRDWIVPAGSPYVQAMVFMHLGSLGFKEVQVLRWDNRDRVYRECFLSIN